MKLRKIFRFEFTYQVRRLSTWLCFALLFVFAFWTMVGTTPTDSEEFLNAPFTIVFFTVLGGVIWLLTAAWIAGEIAARDMQTRMHPLTYTMPVSKMEYLGGRFLAAFATNALIMTAVPAGILLAVSSPWVETELLGPFRPAAYLTAYGLIALPFAFAGTAVQFSSAALSRSPMASYLASVLLFIFSTFVLASAAELLQQGELVHLLDLVGIGGIVKHFSERWTAAEMNTRLVGLEGGVLANRLIWIAIAGAVLAFTYTRFRLAHPAASVRRTLLRRRVARPLARQVSEDARTAPIDVPQVRQSFGRATYVRQTLGIARTSFRAIAKSRGGLLLLVAIPALIVAVLPQGLELQGVPLVPKTSYLLTLLTAPLTEPFTPWVIVPLLIVLYAGGLVWGERNAGMSEIADAAPVPEWSLFLGRFLGLGLILVAWMALVTLAGVLVQVGMGHYEFDIGLYLQILFGLRLPEYLLFALLALGVHALVNQQYVGHILALAAYAYIAFAPNLGLEHNLLIYGAGPGWSYTEMRGFGPSLWPWIWFKLYWAAWALLLAVLAVLFWVRGREGRIRERLRAARRRFTRPLLTIAAAAVGLILTLGGFIFYNTNVLNQHDTQSGALQRLAEYEQRYGRYQDIPQPSLTESKLHVEIYPDRRVVEIRGTYGLVNAGAVAVGSIHVATVPDVETGAITFDRPSAPVLLDEELGHRIYSLERLLEPGDSLRLSFTVHVEARGFQNSGTDPSVAANGTYFTSEEWLPAIGYQSSRELRGARDRRAQGLAPRPVFRSLEEMEARNDSVRAEWVAFEAVVGTQADQIAVAPGALRETWTERERRYFRYSTDVPIASSAAFFSANYAVREDRWQDLAIQIFHHPEHTANLDRMLRSVRASLDYYTEQFGPYPYRQLKLVEHPGMGGMNAHASVIAFQEGFFLFHPQENPRSPDFPFAVVAHEVAHQWWGSHLARERVEGIALLSEALAEYSAWRVVENTYGPEHLRRIIRNALGAEDAVLLMRAAGPLLRATDRFLAYGKGASAVYALSDYLGEDRVNQALRQFYAKHGSGAAPLATSLDLYRELQAVTPDSMQYLLHDLFVANTFWDLEIEESTAVQTAVGTWQVTLDVRARKIVVDSTGVEAEVPMDDWVEVGVFAPAGATESDERSLYLEMHRIKSGEQRITLTVSSQPSRAEIDPRHLLIDLERSDNDQDFNSTT